MAKLRGDTHTMDLLSWEELPIVEAFDPSRVRAMSLRAKTARAVSEAMTDCDLSRADVAEKMSVFMGETVSVNMLNAYASEAREEHSISFVRMVGLIHATDDIRLLQIVAEMFGYSVIEDKFLPWVDLGMAADRKETVVKDFEYKRRLARMGAK